MKVKDLEIFLRKHKLFRGQARSQHPLPNMENAVTETLKVGAPES